jgi:hypothetical protein
VIEVPGKTLDVTLCLCRRIPRCQASANRDGPRVATQEEALLRVSKVAALLGEAG